MQSVGSFFSTVSKFYNELNPATLSGAIDVVVVEQVNGDLACSPFHVRFGKLSILRPQEKVVEVTINGRVVDFPMKVGDAGEAFFVFETEQDVPEEFVTSPLAGPSTEKIEEEIDFLDLAQGGRGTAHPPDDIDTGYVSANSGHGSEFEEDEQADLPPQLDKLEYPLTALHGNMKEKNFCQEDTLAVTTTTTTTTATAVDTNPALERRVRLSRSRWSLSMSLPPSPTLMARDIMENFRPVDSAGPFEDNFEDTEEQLLNGTATVAADDGSRLLSVPKDDVLMDMTGYKTDESAETDLDSEGSSELDANTSNGRRRRKKVSRRTLRDISRNFGLKGRLVSEVSGDAATDAASARVGNALDARLPLRPTLRPTGRAAAPGSYRKRRSSSMPDLRESVCMGVLKNLMTTTIIIITSIVVTILKTSIAMETIFIVIHYQTPRTAKSTQDTEWSWGWGSLPVKNDSLDSVGETDKKEQQQTSQVSIDIPAPSKPALNVIEIDGVTYRLAISLCPGDDFGKDLEASEALFAANQISFEDFSLDPLKLLNNKSLPLSDETLHQLSAKDSRHLSDRLHVHDEPPTRFGALSRWLRGSQTSTHLTGLEQGQRHRSPSSESAMKGIQAKETVKDDAVKIAPYPQFSPEPMTRSTSLPVENGAADMAVDEETGPKRPQNLAQNLAQKSSKRYAKTLRLTSEQLKSLNLKKGANTLTFSVTSSYQGKAVCSAKLFLWDHDYQVVISDIDGTITKSDALGHIFTMAGKDWTHSGVAKLYTDITNNGYHILYLTSRAIGQADYTRKYLKNVEQNNYQLPDGPVIMSPDRLMTAFHREVIMRKPEEFKMSCLRDIRRLFGDRNPFYAGFGNRITDALSYRSVNVPSSRIFTIDSGGEVKLELLSSYKSSYLALNDLVNEIFPGQRQAPEFNDWNFWRSPLPQIELPIIPPHQPVIAAVPGEYNPHAYSGGGGPGRLGVIRSLTSSLTSAGPLKKRTSIPTFGSTPSSPLTSYPSPLPLSHSPPRSHPQSHSPPPPPPPGSAPAPTTGFQIADRTRRLSFSLMRYGGHSVASSPTVVKPLADSQDTNRSIIENEDPGTHTAEGHFVAFNPAEVRVVDVPLRKRVSSFSVSPPQLASRLTETVIPFLRGKASKSELDQAEVQQQQQHTRDPRSAHSSGHGHESDIVGYGDKHGGYDDERVLTLDMEGFGQEAEDEGEGVEEYGDYYDNEEEDLDEDHLEAEEEDDDDVELNIDAPFL
ncbi:hypothetical protein BGX28_005232 [Mortierella sp. GBA30]|nr:hypothetical protein BGX28_005232 [Mortierella sp. GBA30]